MISQQERQDLETTVKELIKDSISSKINDTDIKERGFARFDVIASFLSDIMALGYNNNSKELAADDIWELQSQMPWTNTNRDAILRRVGISADRFQTEVDSFLVMVKSIATGDNKQTIIDKVKATLAKN
ncbi:MAG: hypothetical protein KDD32_01350 [Bacteroidetes bacterium]|nr:hypothetical protein [Bacteroidota bacterium]